MCDLFCDITSAVCQILCCYNRKSYGSILPPGVELPRTPSQITAEFLTVAFHSYGTYPASVTVTSVEFLKAPRTGLLSDIHRIAYKVSDGRETKPCYVKFAPLQLKTRLTTDLFKMGETEVSFYHDIQNVFPMTTPKSIFADIDRRTKTYVLITEDLGPEVEFMDQLEPKELTLNDVKLILKNMACVHAKFLGPKRCTSAPELKSLMTTETKRVKLTGLVAKLAYKNVYNKTIRGCPKSQLTYGVFLFF